MSGRKSGSFGESGDREQEFEGKLTECLGLTGGFEKQGDGDAEKEDNSSSIAAGADPMLPPAEEEYVVDAEVEETVAMLSDRVANLLKAKLSPRLVSPVSPDFGNGAGDAQAQSSSPQNEEKQIALTVVEEATNENGDHAFQTKGLTLSDEEIQDGSELGVLVKGCQAVRETMNTYREQEGSSGPEHLPNPRVGKIGGDIEYICKSAIVAGLSNGDGENKEVSNEMATTVVTGREQGKEAASPNNPNSGGVGVAPGSQGKKQKKKDTPGAPHELGDSVKKLPPSLVGNKSSRPVSGTQRNFTPLVLKPSPSPSKSASSTAKSSKSPYSPLSPSGKTLVPLVRAQTARSSRPEESPLTADGLLLGISPNPGRTPDFSRLFKPTASSSAKYSLGSPSTPKPSPSKSLGDNRLRKSTSMMGDAGASGSGSPAAPVPATPPIGGTGEPGSSSLKEQFTAFSRFGDATSDGKQITLSNADKWMKQAHVVDGKKITTTDTSITFKKLFKTAKKVGFEDFKRYVEDLAKSKGMEGKDILEKLGNCGPPGHSSATKAAHAGVVSRLTDTSKYTGSHQERFDASGKGKGIEGRRDVQDNSGYVAAFKAKQESSPAPK